VSSERQPLTQAETDALVQRVHQCAFNAFMHELQRRYDEFGLTEVNALAGLTLQGQTKVQVHNERGELKTMVGVVRLRFSCALDWNAELMSNLILKLEAQGFQQVGGEHGAEDHQAAVPSAEAPEGA
jgi:hypothetical protein